MKVIVDTSVWSLAFSIYNAARFLGFEQTAVPCLRNPLAPGD